MEKANEIVGTVVLGLVTVALVALIMALPLMFLWNTCLVPAVEAINPIGFWQSLGLNFLFSIMFKSQNLKKD